MCLLAALSWRCAWLVIHLSLTNPLPSLWRIVELQQPPAQPQPQVHRSLNAPLFVFATPAVSRLPLLTELRTMQEIEVVASLRHFIADASFEDLRLRLDELRPGGLHIATHIDPTSGFMLRENGSNSGANGDTGTYDR